MEESFFVEGYRPFGIGYDCPSIVLRWSSREATTLIRYVPNAKQLFYFEVGLKNETVCTEVNPERELPKVTFKDFPRFQRYADQYPLMLVRFYEMLRSNNVPPEILRALGLAEYMRLMGGA